jgi:hypothetical protein
MKKTAAICILILVLTFAMGLPVEKTIQNHQNPETFHTQ